MTYSLDRAEKRRQRLIRRRVESAPLLAALDDWEPVPDAVEIQRDVQRMWEECEAVRNELHARFRAQAAENRRIVAAWVTPEELRALDDHRNILPPMSGYDADYWWRAVRDIGVARAIRSMCVIDIPGRM